MEFYKQIGTLLFYYTIQVKQNKKVFNTLFSYGTLHEKEYIPFDTEIIIKHDFTEAVLEQTRLQNYVEKLGFINAKYK